jgi:hypothetical protein
MSQTQLNRFVVITKVIDGHLSVSEAATLLGLSTRQVIRIRTLSERKQLFMAALYKRHSAQYSVLSP